jgi:phenylalanyl-tRNA synthetase alpha chain
METNDDDGTGRHPCKLLAEALAGRGEAADERALDEVRVRFLGKKGEITAQLKSLGN